MTDALALSSDDAADYAKVFACLAEPSRLRLLQAVSASTSELTVGQLTELLGLGQPTCSHHVRRLADAGLVRARKVGIHTLVSVDQTGRARLPQLVDVVAGLLAVRPCCPEDLPEDVSVRALAATDWPDVRRIYAEGIATGDATFETDVPGRAALEAKWLSGHRWVAEIGGRLVGWTAISSVSARDCYAGVGESSVYVGSDFRGRGVGRTLLHRQVTAADANGLWTLQTSIFPENRRSLVVHHAAGYRTVGVRERIARDSGVWRDTVLLERRSPVS